MFMKTAAKIVFFKKPDKFSPYKVRIFDEHQVLKEQNHREVSPTVIIFD